MELTWNIIIFQCGNFYHARFILFQFIVFYSFFLICRKFYITLTLTLDFYL